MIESPKVPTYTLKEQQREKTLVLMLCENFTKGIENFIDQLLENEAQRIKSLIQNADPRAKDWEIAYLLGYEAGIAELNKGN